MHYVTHWNIIGPVQYIVKIEYLLGSTIIPSSPINYYLVLEGCLLKLGSRSGGLGQTLRPNFVVVCLLFVVLLFFLGGGRWVGGVQV